MYYIGIWMWFCFNVCILYYGDFYDVRNLRRLLFDSISI